MNSINDKTKRSAGVYSGAGRSGLKRNVRWSESRFFPAVLLAVCLFMVFLVGVSPGLRRLFSSVMQPLLSGGRQGIYGVTEGIRSVMPLSAMERRRLEDLQQRVNQLQTELTAAQEKVEENRQLRQLLDLPPPPGWKRLPALVIARDPVSWNLRFRIDRGVDDGVSEGNLVMVGDEAAGRVVEASARSSLVATVADPEFRLSVRLHENRVTGVLVGGQQRVAGKREKAALVDFLPRDNVYREGELVETSGLSGYVPGGVPVARVVNWNRRKTEEIIDSSFARLRVVPVADLTDFRVVSVLLPVYSNQRSDGI